MTTTTEHTSVPEDVEKGTIRETQSTGGMKGHISDALLKHSHDADTAMKAFEGFEGQTIELTEEANRKLLRKIDLHLMPVRTKFFAIAFFA
jgi:ACS family allantoate permease-like MFS transporter